MTISPSPLPLNDLLALGRVDKVIVESLEQALYRLKVEHQGQRFYVIERAGKSLTRRSIVALQALLGPLVIDAMFLRHHSPYDEMIGLESAAGGNELLVPLGNYFEGQTPDA